jgi:hypothetical protein
MEEERLQELREDKRLRELMDEYDAIMAKKFNRALESGYGIDAGIHAPEFEDILDPAGFHVCQADKLETFERDEYVLRVARKTLKGCNGDTSTNQGDSPVCPGVSHCPAAVPRQ